MTVIDRAILTMRAYAQRSERLSVDARAQLVVAFTYVALVVSVPVDDPCRLVWFLCYPIVMAEAMGLGYGRVFIKSLWVLPLVGVIGIFNPLFDHQPVELFDGVIISHGWLSFVTLTLRGLLAMQALILLADSCGFYAICGALRRLGVPRVMVTQLSVLYRYIMELLYETQTMERARQSRGYGRRSYPLAMWAQFVGQLLLRSVNRAKRVGNAMIARGFDGSMPDEYDGLKLRSSDVLYMVGWCSALIVCRFVDLTHIISLIV